MLLVQRIPDESSAMILRVVGQFYKNMKALEQDMKEHPANFNEDHEYSLIDPRPLVKVTWEKKATIESTAFDRKYIKEEKK